MYRKVFVWLLTFRDIGALVVAAQQEQRGRVADLECPEVEHAFDREIASIHVVAQEQVLGRCR